MQRYAATGQDYDSKKYPLCCPTNGARGEDAQRFHDQFLSAAQTVSLDPETLLDETVSGTDQGGGAAGAPPIPAGNAMAGANTARTSQLLAASR